MKLKLFRVLFSLLLSVLLVALVAACGDDDESGTNGDSAATATEDGGTPEATEEETEGPTDAGGEPSEEVTVELDDFSFDPDSFTVTAGTEVKIDVENVGAAPHTLTVYSDEEYTEPVDGADTGQVEGGEDGEFFATFDAGEYFFRCEVHPTQMEGTLTAE
jgi:plastocyanin